MQSNPPVDGPVMAHIASLYISASTTAYRPGRPSDAGDGFQAILTIRRRSASPIAASRRPIGPMPNGKRHATVAGWFGDARSNGRSLRRPLFPVAMHADP